MVLSMGRLYGMVGKFLWVEMVRFLMLVSMIDRIFLSMGNGGGG